MSKGSARRPGDREAYERNYDAIFAIKTIFGIPVRLDPTMPRDLVVLVQTPTVDTRPIPSMKRVP